MNQSGKIHFDREQVNYLIKKTGQEDPQAAVEAFANLIRLENIDPFKMHEYLKRLMEKDGFGHADSK